MKAKSGSLTKKVLAVFTLIVILECGYLFALTGLLLMTKKQLDTTREAQKIVAVIATFSSTMQKATAAIVDQMRTPTMTERYKNLFVDVPRDYEILKLALKNNPEEKELLAQFDRNIHETLEMTRKTVDSYRHAPLAEHHGYASNLFRGCLAVTDKIESLNNKYLQIELENNAALSAQSNQLLLLVLIGGLLINTLVAVLIYFFFVRDLVQRLNLISTNVKKFGQGQPLPPPVKRSNNDGGDEITALDQAFRQLANTLDARKSKEAVILENSGAFICSLNKDGIIVTAPTRSSAAWGFSPEELIGRRFISLVKDVKKGATYEALQNARNSPANFETQLELKNGTVLDLAWSAQAASDEHIVCLAHDITKRREGQLLMQKNEAELRTLIEKLPLAIIVCNKMGDIIRANRHTFELSNCRAHELIGAGRKVSDLFPEENLSSLSTAAAPALQTVQLTRNGSTIPVELSVTAFTLSPSASEPEMLLLSFRDVSMRLEIEQAKRDFVSMIAHDLRSPLTALFGTLTILAADEVNDTVFSRGEKTVSALINLTSDFLTLGKLEAGHQILDLNKITLATIREQLLDCESLAAAAELPHIDIAPQSQPLQLTIDPAYLYKCLEYLVELQKFFAPPAAPTVINILRQGQWIVFLLRAQGAALPQTVKETLSDGYALISTTPTSKFSQLYMALTRAIVKAHGGELTVETENTGEAFVLKLPL